MTAPITNLLAAQANNMQITNAPNVNAVQDANQFHNLVNASFNNYMKINHAQILSQITNANPIIASHNASSNGFLGLALQEVRKKTSAQEATIEGVLTGDVSVSTLFEKTKELENTIQICTTIRNKFVETLDKFMNTPI
ncbi:MAG: flagellar hook-basal body complex protein FliE [Rickettsiaceae bacterium]